MSFTFVKAGLVVLSIDLPEQFLETCKQCNTTPEQAAGKFLSLLGMHSLHGHFHQPYQDLAAALFLTIAKYSTGGQSQKVDSLTEYYLDMLHSLEEKQIEEQIRCRIRFKIISEWYQILQNNCL